MPEALRYNTYLNRACREVNGFEALLQRFERNISILGRSPRTFDNYSRHVAAMALHFQCLPTALDPEQVKDYLYELQQRSQTPSQTYFKHTVYGLRFLLKTEGLPYEHLHLPAIARPDKLPVILSRQEVWRMLHGAQLLKHKLLIGLLYGCGLRCQEVRNIEMKHLDFDRLLLHIVQSKGNKDRYVPLSAHLAGCSGCQSLCTRGCQCLQTNSGQDGQQTRIALYHEQGEQTGAHSGLCSPCSAQYAAAGGQSQGASAQYCAPPGSAVRTHTTGQ